jgi:predicted methyltransferase
MLRAAMGLVAALSACVLIDSAALAASPPKYVTAAVKDPARPDADKMRDAERKPAETLTFAGIKPGQQVAEFIPGGGYFTRLISKIVGPSGHVYALVPPPRPNAPPGAPNMAAAVEELGKNPAYANVSVVFIGQGGPGLGLPQPADVVWTSQNYHDFHNRPNADMTAFNKQVFDALKPGGTYFVLDHAAAAGAGTTVTGTLHRIEPAAAKMEIESAGFKLAGESDVLHNPDDPHTANVRDPSIRGKTDQFMLKFTKP